MANWLRCQEIHCLLRESSPQRTLIGDTLFQYVRLEEVTVGSAALERSLSVLHEGLISSCPSLLPAFRELFKDIQSDRAHSIQQRVALLSLSSSSSSSASSSASAAANKQLQRQNTTDSRLAYGGRSDVRRHSPSGGISLTSSTKPLKLSNQFSPQTQAHTHNPATLHRFKGTGRRSVSGMNSASDRLHTTAVVYLD